MCKQLVIESISGEAGLAIGRGHGVVVGAIKAIENIVDKFTLIDGLAKRNELSAKTLHLGKVLSHGEGVLLGVIQGTTECIDLGWRGSGKHPGDGGPDVGSGLQAEDMREELRRQGVEQVASNSLITRNPGSVGRVGDGDLLAVGVLGG
jgi:hypothetical protein